ncbi:MAG: PD40 domain-containing protein [Prevotellaceae bacterium]|nr:PD40 domain-containing protein [Candidatus Faecinaster equi]
MKLIKYNILIFCVILALVSCDTKYEKPSNALPLNKEVKIFPDYKNVVIPPNIAPMNFMVRSNADECIAEIRCENKSIIGGGEKRKVFFEEENWHQFISSCKGKTAKVTVYAKRNDKWYSFNSYNLTIAPDSIDSYLSYRLIEPGYEYYRQLGLYQRNVENFDVHVIYENNRKHDNKKSHCVNCHNYQNYSTDNMLFHVRGNMGGTLIAHNGKVEKLDMKTDSTLGSAVYPSWHPHKNWIAFSSNLTGQAFHMLGKQKIEVVDHGSDLLFYNVDTKEISNIIKTPGDMETFPTWAPSGDKLYYCVARLPQINAFTDSMRIQFVLQKYDSLLYDIMSVSFDEKTMKFGTPQMEVNCTDMRKSASVPRVSPDGKYLLFTLGRYGQFHIWHKTADQYVKNLQTGKIYPLKAANSKDVDSYHSWSSNGRWIVFSSRRFDGAFTRPYFTYFDKKGIAHKAFMLPQKDPEQNIKLFKSYNVPEMTKTAVKYTKETFKDVIYNTDGTKVKYKNL